MEVELPLNEDWCLLASMVASLCSLLLLITNIENKLPDWFELTQHLEREFRENIFGQRTMERPPTKT
jgi:hypothetical protein